MKAIFIFLFTIVSAAAHSQYKNNLYVSLQPGDLGVGIRYDRSINDLGVYGSGSWGNYTLMNGEYINDHIRFAVGGFFYLREQTNEYIHTKITLGAVYHIYGDRNYSHGIINEDVFFPLSAELGIGTYIKRFACALRFDIIKFEGIIDFGFNF